jgi:hypothetical protein
MEDSIPFAIVAALATIRVVIELVSIRRNRDAADAQVVRRVELEALAISGWGCRCGDEWREGAKYCPRCGRKKPGENGRREGCR